MKQTKPKITSSVPATLKGEITVLNVSIVMMILFAAVHLSSPLRLTGLLPTLPQILLIAYRLMDFVIVVAFLIYCGTWIKLKKLDMLLAVFATYPFIVGIASRPITLTFLNDVVIFWSFIFKIIVFRTVLGRIAAQTDLNTVFRRYSVQIIFWCGAIAFANLALTLTLLRSGVQFYYQASSEITFAAALAISQGNVAVYLMFLGIAVLAGKRMIMIGILTIGLIAALSHLKNLRFLILALLLSVAAALLFFAFGEMVTAMELPFVGKLTGTFNQIRRAYEQSNGLIQFLTLLDPARFSEFVSLQPHLTDLQLWIGNGYGFRYELDSEFLERFGYSNLGEVTNAHFTPLAITAKFGLFGLAIWAVLVLKVLSTKIDNRSFLQHACRLAFASMVVQSFLAFGFFINMFTPLYIAISSINMSKGNS